MTETRPTRAAIYARMSQDRTGAGLGVTRQEEDCRVRCDQLVWPVAEVYRDNDISAYSGKPRPEWERLIADVKAGRIDAIACWHIDRLTRSPSELEDVIALAERHGVALATATGEVDLSTPTGRMVARILGSVARQEMEHKSERQIRRNRQAAENGLRHGGGDRPFGYRWIFDRPEPPHHIIREELDEVEAAIIRECAARVLTGEALSSICRDLRARGVMTSAGKDWVPVKLRKMLVSARISGRREHIPRRSGETKRPIVGEIVATEVEWPAIISFDDSDRLRAMLTNPARRKWSSANGRTYLLSGILRCGRCGTGLVGRPRSGVSRYVCPNTPGKDSCGMIATVAGRTDEHVRDMVLLALDGPGMAERLRARDEQGSGLAEQIRRDETELEEIAADKASGLITRKEWLVQREIVEKRLDAARERLARQSQTSALTTFVGTFDEMRARWELLNVSQRRAIVSAVLISVKVNPANPRKRWDPERFVEPDWRI